MAKEKIIQYTLGSLLEELKESTPKFEKGQYFEVLKSFYPTKEVLFEERMINNVTKPLACSVRNKREFQKDKSFFAKFFKDFTKGDILEIVETDGISAKCINRTLREDIREKYYNTENLKYITISFDDIVNRNIKRVYRGIKKIIS